MYSFPLFLPAREKCRYNNHSTQKTYEGPRLQPLLGLHSSSPLNPRLHWMPTARNAWMPYWIIHEAPWYYRYLTVQWKAKSTLHIMKEDMHIGDSTQLLMVPLILVHSRGTKIHSWKSYHIVDEDHSTHNEIIPLHIFCQRKKPELYNFAIYWSFYNAFFPSHNIHQHESRKFDNKSHRSALPWFSCKEQKVSLGQHRPLEEQREVEEKQKSLVAPLSEKHASPLSSKKQGLHTFFFSGRGKTMQVLIFSPPDA